MTLKINLPIHKAPCFKWKPKLIVHKRDSKHNYKDKAYVSFIWIGLVLFFKIK